MTARAEGGTAASARAVRTTRGRADQVLTGDTVTDDAGEPVWAIEIVGASEFVCASCKGPSGATAPRGSVITLIVQASTLTTLDYGLSDRPGRLTMLGVPVALPLHP
ncbi:hypothetical protein ACEZDB_24225 [Streptacidiphilus sp. N1-3]|uniref:Uncharacterized protein n=1 Tax=Streptacidiphilus alkalitolerans TaxID=3342712 RepID=A0ABV6X6Y2_9ACTN